jgi:CHASE2 domain-containing sensor protein
MTEAMAIWGAALLLGGVVLRRIQFLRFSAIAYLVVGSLLVVRAVVALSGWWPLSDVETRLSTLLITVVAALNLAALAIDAVRANRRSRAPQAH